MTLGGFDILIRLSRQVWGCGLFDLSFSFWAFIGVERIGSGSEVLSSQHSVGGSAETRLY